MTRPPLLKMDRQSRLLRLVAARQQVTLAEMEQELAAPRLTIQRDLVELENNRQLKRFHGGAMSLALHRRYDPAVRKQVNVEGKKKIAVKAVRLFQPGSCVGLDASSTVYYLSEQLLPPSVFVLSCGLDAFKNLAANRDLQAALCGGRLNRDTSTLTGPEAVESIRRFRFDQVFISADAYIPGRGFFDPFAEEVEVKRALMASARRTVMLLDTEKIADRGAIKICGESEVDCLVTDNPAHPELKQHFRKGLV
jgi:DeoR/GlpR family transcriptional regulator of sugar metabolism